MKVIVLLAVSIFLIGSCTKQHDGTNDLLSTSYYLELADSLIGVDPTEAFILLDNMLNDSESIDEETHVRAMLAKGELLYMLGNNDEALLLFYKANNTAEKLGNMQLQLKGMHAYATIIYMRGDYNEALQIFTEVQQLSAKHNFTRENIEATYFIGKYYHTTGNFERSMNFYLKSLKMIPEDEISPLKVNIVLSIGKCYLNAGDTNTALKNYQYAYRIASESGNMVSLANACNHLGSIYNILGQIELSVSYHKQAMQMRESLAYPSDMAKSYNNLGRTYLKAGKTDSALVYFKKSLETSMLSEYKKGTVKALTNLARAEDNLNYARLYAEALEIAEKAGYNAGIANARLHLGNVLLESGNYSEAIENFFISLDKAENSRLSETIPEILYGIYECYLALNDTANALLHLQKYSTLEKEWLIEKSQRQLAEMFVLFEAEEIERNNQILKADNALKEIEIKRKQQQIIISVGALAILMLVSLFTYWRFAHKRKAHKELLHLNRQLGIAIRDKDKLMSIIAHELRNPLYWFQNLTRTLSVRYREMPPEKIEKSLIALDESARNAFHLMDNLLYWSRSKLNRISPKKEKIKLYNLAVQCTQLFSSVIEQKSIHFDIGIPPEIEAFTDPKLMACVIRNLVSNSIKYTPVNGSINISLTRDNGSIEVCVSDTGCGIDESVMDSILEQENSGSTLGLMKEEGSGIGLMLCKDFTEMCGGQFKLDKEYKKGTRFVFTVSSGYSIN